MTRIHGTRALSWPHVDISAIYLCEETLEFHDVGLLQKEEGNKTHPLEIYQQELKAKGKDKVAILNCSTVRTWSVVDSSS